MKLLAKSTAIFPARSGRANIQFKPLGANDLRRLNPSYAVRGHVRRRVGVAIFASFGFDILEAANHNSRVSRICSWDSLSHISIGDWRPTAIVLAGVHEPPVRRPVVRAASSPFRSRHLITGRPTSGRSRQGSAMPVRQALRKAIASEDRLNDRMAEFVELYSGNYPRLQYYVMTLLPGANDVGDVLQETSLVLWRKFDTFQQGTNFFAWACKIARLQALKHREQQGRSAKLFELRVMELLAEEAGEDERAHSTPLPILRGCLDKLSEQERSLILRRYTPGMSVKDLATEVGRSANSLSHSLGRIRRALLECVKRARSGESRH